MPSSSKKKGKLSKEQKERKKQERKFSNQIHASILGKGESLQAAITPAEINNLLAELSRPRSVSETQATIRKLLTISGTNLKQNDDDPFGDGDQSGCGKLGLGGESTRQILRSLFGNGGDIDTYLRHPDALTSFAYACAIGDISTVEQMLKATDFGSEDRMHLLERRETGMRFAPICLCLALYKSRMHVSMRLKISVSGMNHLAVFKLLLKYGARPDVKEVTGKTIIHYGAGSMADATTLKMSDYSIDAAKSSKYFGKNIVLRNLSKVEYNGLEGKLGGYLCDTGRREVLLNNGKSLALKPQNIFVKQGEDVEKCIFDESRNIVNDQDRVGMISLHEVYMSTRVDVAQHLTEKHNVSIDLKDRGGQSVRTMAYNQAGLVSDMTRLIRKYGTKQSRNKDRTCYYCGKYDVNVSKCSRCKEVTYCSSECQRADWKEHKKICQVPVVSSVKLKPPSDPLLYKKHPEFGFNGSYKLPVGVKVNEIFWLKIQISHNGENDNPHRVYDKSQTCVFNIEGGFPGHQEIRNRIKKENTYTGMKGYFKASFGEDGNCTIYLDEFGFKDW